MDVYRLLRINQRIRSHRVKFLGLWVLSVLNRRYLSVQMDPVLACNLRCRMCYFSDPDFVRTSPRGSFDEADLERIADCVFANALKLQIGCGAEPTLFKHNVRLIKIARARGVPYVSMITNGNLLDEASIANFAGAGLDEFILSLHGVEKETYERFMERGSYERFHATLAAITRQKQSHPRLRLRVNYTFNRDNFQELGRFFEVFGAYAIDVLQLRPVDRIGNSVYQEFSLREIEAAYPAQADRMREETRTRGITLMCPQSVVRDESRSLKVESSNDSSYLLPYTYFYISPSQAWRDGFDWRTETFAQWRKRNHWCRALLRNVFTARAKLESQNRNMLNYNVNLG